MRYILAACFVLALAAAAVVRGGEAESSFSPYVDTEGKISVPPNYREWAFLGSWHIAPQKGMDNSAGTAGFHNLYTQLSTVEHYRRTGEFPDGAVLVKELLKTKSGKLTTGDAAWATEIEGWFVIVKDKEGRFPNHPLWGNGWGWSLFSSGDPMNTVTKNWKTDCLACHAPAQNTDWVFLEGYPILRDAGAK